MKLNVLVACEESQAECTAFRLLGHNAFSCDIQPCKKGGHPEWHIRGDATELLKGGTHFETMDGKMHRLKKWHLIVAHPPCTYLCRVGIVHLTANADLEVDFFGKKKMVNHIRYEKMKDARKFFFTCLNARAHYVAVENPTPMALALLPKPDCYLDPSWFGVKYTKKTLYWLKNLPPIMAQKIFPNAKCYVTASRGKYRSRTFPQVAQAIAKQWSDYILDDLKKNH